MLGDPEGFQGIEEFKRNPKGILGDRTGIPEESWGNPAGVLDESQESCRNPEGIPRDSLGIAEGFLRE